MDHHPRPRRPRPASAVVTATLVVALAVPLLTSGSASARSAPAHGSGPRPTIVLVHGDWADGSSWSAVTRRLVRRGYRVVAPPNPLRGPTGDAAHLAAFLATVPGPIVLAAHSYGGFVATNAARGNAAVRALVYVDAFVPDTGQTLAELAVGSCVDPATAFDVVPGPGGVVDLYLHHDPRPPYPGYRECFANGVDRTEAAVLEAGQRPAAADQFTDPSGPPAWRTIPSWSLIGTSDRVITPAQQRVMSTRAGARISTVAAGHLSLVSHPATVADLIETAARARR